MNSQVQIENLESWEHERLEKESKEDGGKSDTEKVRGKWRLWEVQRLL